MKNEGRRLREIRKSLALTQAVFAEGLGLKQGPYSMIESGKVGLSSKVLEKAINTYRVNPVFLFDGQGPMLIDNAVEEKDLTVDIPNIPKDAKANNRIETISLSRLTELRAIYPEIEDITTKNDIIEELINACFRLKDENGQQKDKIIGLMQKLQGLLSSMGRN